MPTHKTEYHPKAHHSTSEIRAFFSCAFPLSVAASEMCAAVHAMVNEDVAGIEEFAVSMQTQCDTGTSQVSDLRGLTLIFFHINQAYLRKSAEARHCRDECEVWRDKCLDMEKQMKGTMVSRSDKERARMYATLHSSIRELNLTLKTMENPHQADIDHATGQASAVNCIDRMARMVQGETETWDEKRLELLTLRKDKWVCMIRSLERVTAPKDRTLLPTLASQQHAMRVVTSRIHHGNKNKKREGMASAKTSPRPQGGAIIVRELDLSGITQKAPPSYIWEKIPPSWEPRPPAPFVVVPSPMMSPGPPSGVPQEGLKNPHRRELTSRERQAIRKGVVADKLEVLFGHV